MHFSIQFVLPHNMYTYFDRKESSIGIFGVLLEEPRNQLKIGSSPIVIVEFTCDGRRNIRNLKYYRAIQLVDIPLLMTSLAPAGKASTPDLILSKASSSETGPLALHLYSERH